MPRTYHLIAVYDADPLRFEDYYVRAPTAVHAYRAIQPYTARAREVWATLWPVPDNGVIVGPWNELHGHADRELHESWVRVQDDYQRMR